MMCVCPRGNRHLSMFFELPAATCPAGAGGVPLSGEEADEILSWVSVPGNFVLLTDGAGAYQSAAPESRVAHHTHDKVRFCEHYKHLNLSHGIVSHNAEEWAVAASVRVVGSDGRTRTVALQKGTQVVDGQWPELRGSIPDSAHSTDWDRCREYMWSFIWRMWRHGRCPLTECGSALKAERDSK